MSIRSMTKVPTRTADARISSQIFVKKSILYSIYSNTEITTLNDMLLLANPAYQAAVRFSRSPIARFHIPKQLNFLEETPDCYVYPRGFREHFEKDGIDLVDDTKIGKRTNYRFLKTLRDYQSDYLAEIPDDVLDLIMQVPCGHGKTILAIYRAWQLKCVSIILVPTLALARQWVARIKDFTDATYFLYESTAKAIPLDRDFYIQSMELFNNREFTDLQDIVGHVIIDEAHRLGANDYLPILRQLPARYRTALTATFRRPDGMHAVLGFHFGVVFTMEYRFDKPKVFPLHTGIYIPKVIPKKGFTQFPLLMEMMNNTKYTETKSAYLVPEVKHINKWIDDNKKKMTDHPKVIKKEVSLLKHVMGTIAYSTYETVLAEHPRRLKLYVNLIKACLDADRTILVIAKRKATLKFLAKFFVKYNPVLFISENNIYNESLREYLDTKCRLVFGVPQLTKEGLDLERLDTLIPLNGMADTEQAIGRISRTCAGKKNPIAFYPIDDNPVAMATWMKARKTITLNATEGPRVTFTTAKMIL